VREAEEAATSPLLGSTRRAKRVDASGAIGGETPAAEDGSVSVRNPSFADETGPENRKVPVAFAATPSRE
jgi:hypothetical protein